MLRMTLGAVFFAACAPSGARGNEPPSCDDGVKNGDESDVDCGGSTCPRCVDGLACTGGDDCASKVCNKTCSAPSCSDGVQNGDELGVDCGGPVCPVVYAGIGCTQGTNGSQVCTSYSGGPKFTVTVTWSAAGGNAYVDYVTAYGANGEDYNGMGEIYGVAINVCQSGAYSQTFELPLGVGYTYKIWHAYCVRTDACSGCGDDTTTATGGPFGVVPTC